MKEKKEARKMTTIYVDPSVYEQIMDIRWDVKKSFNAICREALDKWLELYKNR